MPLIALASVKASPGVTTTALALAAAWPSQRRLLLEADPGGGDLGPWLGLPPAPGLVGLAAAARHDHGSDVLWEHAQEVAGGVHVVVAPVGAEQAVRLRGNTERERGRPRPIAPRASRSDRGLRPPRPRLHGAGYRRPGRDHLADRAPAGQRTVPPRARGLPGCPAPGCGWACCWRPATGRGARRGRYAAQEIAATLDVPVHASIPADPRGAAHLIGSRGGLGKAVRQAAAGAGCGQSRRRAGRRPPASSQASRREPAAPVRAHSCG